MQEAAAVVVAAILVVYNLQYMAYICRCTIREFNYSIFVKHCYEIVFFLGRSVAYRVEC